MERRAELKRTKPLRAKASLKQGPQLQAKARRLPQQSKKTRKDQPRRRKVREAVFARDQGCVLARLEPEHRCMGGRTVHHLRKASQGGAYDDSNLIELCAQANGMIEDRPDWAHSLGLVIRREYVA